MARHSLAGLVTDRIQLNDQPEACPRSDVVGSSGYPLTITGESADLPHHGSKRRQIKLLFSRNKRHEQNDTYVPLLYQVRLLAGFAAALEGQPVGEYYSS